MSTQFHSIEDLLIWRAFVTVSIAYPPWSPKRVPTSRKFRQKMYKLYCAGVENERRQLAKAARPKKSFAIRTMESVVSRYNDKIGPEAARFMSVMKTTTLEGDKPDEVYFEVCREKYREKHGSSFAYRLTIQDGDIFLFWRNNFCLDDTGIFFVNVVGGVSSSFTRSLAMLKTC